MHTNIIQPNVKGQIVIPKDIRDKTGITPSSLLTISLEGQQITIKRVHDVITDQPKEPTYLYILQKTIGAWGEDLDSPEATYTRELAAAKKRKTAQW